MTCNFLSHRNPSLEAIPIHSKTHKIHHIYSPRFHHIKSKLLNDSCGNTRFARWKRTVCFLLILCLYYLQCVPQSCLPWTPFLGFQLNTDCLSVLGMVLGVEDEQTCQPGRWIFTWLFSKKDREGSIHIFRKDLQLEAEHLDSRSFKNNCSHNDGWTLVSILSLGYHTGSTQVLCHGRNSPLRFSVTLWISNKSLAPTVFTLEHMPRFLAWKKFITILVNMPLLPLIILCFNWASLSLSPKHPAHWSPLHPGSEERTRSPFQIFPSSRPSGSLTDKSLQPCQSSLTMLSPPELTPDCLIHITKHLVIILVRLF